MDFALHSIHGREVGTPSVLQLGKRKFDELQITLAPKVSVLMTQLELSHQKRYVQRSLQTRNSGRNIV